MSPSIEMGMPDFIARWPAGMVPTSISATGSAVVLTYISTAARLEVVVRVLRTALSVEAGSSSGLREARIKTILLGVRRRLSLDERAAVDLVRRATRSAAAGQVRPSWSTLASALRGLASGDPDAFLAPVVVDESFCGNLFSAVSKALLGERRAARIALTAAADQSAHDLECRALVRLAMFLDAPPVAARVAGEVARRSGRDDDHWAAARAFAAAESGPETHAHLSEIDPKTPEARVEASALLATAGDFRGAVTVVAEGSEPTIVLRRARLLLDAGKAEEARALVTPHLFDEEHGARAHVITAAALVLMGKPHDAINASSHVLATNAEDDEALMWRAQAYLGAGDVQRAHRDVMRVGYADSPLWQLLRTLVELRSRGRATIEGDKAYIHRALLVDLFGDDVRESLCEVDSLDRCLVRALALFGGNRREALTIVKEGDLEAESLRTVRTKAVDLQHRLLYEDPSDVRRAFHALDRAHPSTPFGRTYEAEIDLWLGNYEDALARFESVWADTRTRWGYVGSGAALFLLGRHDEALARFEEGFRTHSELVAEASYAYRGELYRGRGEVALARADLERAVANRPTRLGGWINLALLELSVGREVEPLLARISAMAPALIWHAQKEEYGTSSSKLASADAARVLERALSLMKGNRSSVLHSFVPADGRLRIQAKGDVATLVTWAGRVSDLAAELEAMGSLALRR